MIRLESVHAKETTVWVYKMKSIFQVSILIAIALVCGSTFTMAGEPLSMDQLVDDQLVDEKEAEVNKFILKMLEVGTEKSLENQCDDFVTKLVEGFTNDVKDKINCKLAGKCGRESVLLDIEDAPALRDLFSTASAEPEATAEPAEAGNAEAEKEMLQEPAVKEPAMTHLASVKHMERSDAAVKKIVQGAEASKEALSAASAIVDGKLKNFAMAKQVTHETMQEINDILDHIADTCKIVEVINGKCKVSVNVENLESGLESLFDQVDKCVKNGAPCEITAPFAKEKLTEQKTTQDVFIEITNELNSRALSKAQQRSLMGSLSEKEVRKYIDIALDVNGDSNKEVQTLLQGKSDGKIKPKKFRNCSKLEEMYELIRGKNITIENKIYELMKECVAIKTTDGSSDVEDTRTEQDNRIIHCENERKFNAELFCPRSGNNDAKAEAFHGKCFLGNDFEDQLMEKENSHWWNSSSEENKMARRYLCGVPKFFDVEKGINGAAVSLDALLPRAFVDTLVEDYHKKDDERVYDLEAVSDACGHSAHHAIDVSVHDRNLVVEINCAKMGERGCRKYMCDGPLSAVSEIHIAYRAAHADDAKHNFNCKWVTFAAARVQGSTVTVAPPSCQSVSQNSKSTSSRASSRRRRRLLTPDRRNSAGSCC
jgi:hypothetical protein